MGLPNSLDVQMANAISDLVMANPTAAKLEWAQVNDGPNSQDIAAAQAEVAATQALQVLAYRKTPFVGRLMFANSKVGGQVALSIAACQMVGLSRLYRVVGVSELDFPQMAYRPVGAAGIGRFSRQHLPGQGLGFGRGGQEKLEEGVLNCEWTNDRSQTRLIEPFKLHQRTKRI
jgi:hypothetical protein